MEEMFFRHIEIDKQKWEKRKNDPTKDTRKNMNILLCDSKIR